MKDDPLRVATAGRVCVNCQIIHVEHRNGSTLVDLVTLERCDRGAHQLPSGTPLALGFDAYVAQDQMQIEALMTQWEAEDALLHLDVADAPDGLRYQFTWGEQELTLLVDS